MASKEEVESKLEYALSLAARGFYVFPIKSGQKTPPLVKFKEAATRDEQQIRNWWGLPNHQPNIGVYTGRFGEYGQALVVVDVDTKKNGDGSLFDLELAGYAIPETFTQRTPTGGRHIVYRHLDALRQGVDVIGSGLDIRSRGGFFVAAGSSVDAGQYVVERDLDVAVCPGWLVDALAPSKSSKRKRTGRSGLPSDDAPPVVVGKRERAIRWLAGQPGAVQGDGGDHHTFATACAVFDYGLTNEECFELLFSHPDIDSSWNARCTPPWSPDDLRTKIDNALAYRAEPVGSALPNFPPVGGSVPAQPSAVETPGPPAPAAGDSGADSQTPVGIAPDVSRSNDTSPAHGYVIQLTGAERPNNRSFAAMSIKLFRRLNEAGIR